MAFLKHIRHCIEYGLARVLLFFFDYLPFGITRGLAKGAAVLWWWVDRRRQKVSVANILRAGIVSEESEARVIAKTSIKTFSILVLESLKSSRILEDDTWREHITLNIAPDVQAVLEDPEQGLILAAGFSFGKTRLKMRST